MLFEQFNVAADGAVADMQFFGCAAEALVASGGGKGANGIEWGKVGDHVSNLVTYEAQLKRLSGLFRPANLQPFRGLRIRSEAWPVTDCF